MPTNLHFTQKFADTIVATLGCPERVLFQRPSPVRGATDNVVDPTGAGDSHAGGIMGAYAEDPKAGPGRQRRAIACGTVVASLTVEDFSLDRLQRTTRAEIDRRLEEHRRMLEF